jgi:hypothetical protein
MGFAGIRPSAWLWPHMALILVGFTLHKTETHHLMSNKMFFDLFIWNEHWEGGILKVENLEGPLYGTFSCTYTTSPFLKKQN